MTKPTSLWGATPPDRIWFWQDSQLSVARHYGGCTFRGVTYVIDEVTEGNPLVRLDVISRENKARAQAAKLARAEASEKQQEIF